MLNRREFLAVAGLGTAAALKAAASTQAKNLLDLTYTDPVEPTIPEGCSKSEFVDTTVYSVPDPVVVDSQSAYKSPLKYSDLDHSSKTEWRLAGELRAAAARPGFDCTSPMPIPLPSGWDVRTPLDTLRSAASDLASSGGQLESNYRIRALTDLAVTGRLAYETLSQIAFTTPDDVVNAMSLGPSLRDPALKVVQRAQKVAWAIRGGPSWRAALRPQLGWIGVSGEDDAPHRPCNVPSLPCPQYDIKVPVGGLTVTTRIAIAEMPYPTPVSPVGVPPTFLPPDDVPTMLRQSDVIFLYMPGDSSRAEEASDLIPAIFATAAANGKKASVISFDMIGWGYSARRAFDSSGTPVLFDQTLFPVVDYPANPPALQFVEDFVVSLLNALHVGPPFINLNRVVPIGGSLGGNLALRLGRRSNLSWMKAVCAWSPGSVWPSKATHPDTAAAAGMGAAAGCTLGAAIGSFVPGIGNIIGAAIGCSAGAIGGAIGGSVGDQKAIDQLGDEMRTLEDCDQRQKHFAEIFDKATVPLAFITLVPSQAKTWYRDDWRPCKDVSISQDRLDRREVYDQTFRRWHDRISQDQLVYSHRDKDPSTGTPRYLLNTVPMLLAAGEKDDYTFVKIYSYTRDLAKKMTVPGTTLFLKDTGHSIHNERPMQLAKSIFDFLDIYWTPVPLPRKRDLSYLVTLS